MAHRLSFSYNAFTSVWTGLKDRSRHPVSTPGPTNTHKVIINVVLIMTTWSGHPLLLTPLGVLYLWYSKDIYYKIYNILLRQARSICQDEFI
eukprot:jgi/Botrbrau1/7860/Bobra.9_2s0036.1